MRRGRAWVWHGLEEVDFPGVSHGSGGGWQDRPDPDAPVIHLPNGEKHEVRKPAREPIGFKR